MAAEVALEDRLDQRFWPITPVVVILGVISMFLGDFLYLIAFTEQGTASSHMTAIKFLDFIARLPGNKSEDSDAVSAYTQVTWEEGKKLHALLPDLSHCLL